MYGVDNMQLPLFAHNHFAMSLRKAWWMRNVASSSNFASLTGTGNAGDGEASLSRGIRPAFGICKANPEPQDT